jgi:hypothetical protein
MLRYISRKCRWGLWKGEGVMRRLSTRVQHWSLLVALAHSCCLINKACCADQCQWPCGQVGLRGSSTERKCFGIQTEPVCASMSSCCYRTNTSSHSTCLPRPSACSPACLPGCPPTRLPSCACMFLQTMLMLSVRTVLWWQYFLLA